jgi:hypothetical protein
MLGSLISKDTEKQIAQAVRAASLAKAAESLSVASANVADADANLSAELRATVSRLHDEVKTII